MALQNTLDSTPTSSSLRQIATQFLLTLSSEQRLEAQQEVYKFVRWYGEERPLSELTIPEVANYTEQITSSTTEPAEKLGVVKTFLAYGHKQGLTKTNLAAHLKIKKTPSKSASPSKRHYRKTAMLTAQGYANLQAELTALRNKRPLIAEELRKAAADKDFRENAPLEATREYQGQLEARIKKLELTLSMATVMDEKQDTNHEITIGDTVVLQDLASWEQAVYTLVDSSEANPSEGKISAASPIGQALLGQQKDDKVDVIAPAGILHYQIEDIKHR